MYFGPDYELKVSLKADISAFFVDPIGKDGLHPLNGRYGPLFEHRMTTFSNEEREFSKTTSGPPKARLNNSNCHVV